MRVPSFSNIAALVLVLGALFVFTHRDWLSQLSQGPEVMAKNASQTAGVTQSASSSAPIATTTVVSKQKTIHATSTIASLSPKKSSIKAKISAPAASAPSDQVTRIQNPYPFAALDPSVLNDSARATLVNILCLPTEGGSEGVSGSGVIIDPRGVILTNAHVAQYVLLAESGKIDLSCVARTGSPAQARWTLETLYLPSVWVDIHAGDIKSNVRATGTGEHDYALLRVNGSIDGSPLSPFPSLPIDTRETIGFQDDQVLVASYPAEFSNALSRSGFYSVSSYSTIKQLMTFASGSIDVYSLGGIIVAQNGSSGGAVVNLWGRLIGVVVTTSAGATTGERDLHALTLNYIDRDLKAQTGHDIGDILANDISAEATDFNTNVAPTLVQKFLSVLSP